jgi:hypothetical protein
MGMPSAMTSFIKSLQPRRNAPFWNAQPKHVQRSQADNIQRTAVKANMNDWFAPENTPPQNIWLGGKVWVSTQTLFKRTVPDIMKNAGIPPEMLSTLEKAMSHFGAGLKRIYASQTIPQIITELGYSTDDGIRSLCFLAQEREIKVLWLEAALNVDENDWNTDDLIDVSTEELSTTPDNLDDEHNDIPRLPHLPKPAESLPVLLAIKQGKSVAEIVTDPAHKCSTASQILEVLAAKMKHENGENQINFNR